MTAQHTPGPWFHRQNTGNPSRVICAPNRDPICTVYGEDDAALIAAGPELLAALKNVLANATYPTPCSKPIGAPGSVARIQWEYDVRCYSEAMAAIAKAEGR